MIAALLARLEKRFKAAGLRIGHDRFRVPGHGGSRNVWLIATGAEERPYTGQADHLGAKAAVPRVKRRVKDLRFVLSLDEVKDAGSGNSDHREFTLAGLPAAELGVPDEPCRHTACDTPDRLEPRAFKRVPPSSSGS